MVELTDRFHRDKKRYKNLNQKTLGRTHLIKSELKPRSLNCYLEMLSACFSFAIYEDLLQANPVIGIKRMHYPALRKAVMGIDCPLETDPFSYVAAHELAHCCQTKCLDSFKQLSGWIYIANRTITDPLTRKTYTFAPDEIIPGSLIKFNDTCYVISNYEEVAKFDWSFGEETIQFKNPYSVAGSRWAYREGSSFVNEYAAESPFEDYAESMTQALFTPEILQTTCPDKALFMKYAYGLSMK